MIINLLQTACVIEHDLPIAAVGKEDVMTAFIVKLCEQVIQACRVLLDLLEYPEIIQPRVGGIQQITQQEEVIMSTFVFRDLQIRVGCQGIAVR